MPSLPQMAKIARRFLIDVVRRLKLEEGIRQFLDIRGCAAHSTGSTDCLR
jgi:hypothetical protein